MATTYSVNINEIIADQLKLKYKIITPKEVKSISNMPVDSFYPYFLFQAYKNKKRIFRPKISNYAISEFIANEMNVRQINIEEMIAIVGYKTSQIKRLLIDIKKKKFSIALLGFGGGNNNFIYWLKRLMNHTLTFNIFDELTVYDDDIITETNIIRFPFDIRTKMQSKWKVDLINYGPVISSKIFKKYEKFDTQKQGLNKNTIYIGGPDIFTRKVLSEQKDIVFYSMTHGDNEIQIYLNPPQDIELQIESYGTIDLSIFFMNQFMATIQMLEELNKIEKQDFPELSKKSEKIFSFNFAEYAAQHENNKIIASGRTYIFIDSLEQQEPTEENNNNEGDENAAE